MIVSISGRQGEGKTTILNKLKDAGICVIDNHVARTALDKTGLSLENINHHSGLKRKFQDAVLQGYADLLGYDVIHSKSPVIMERSLVDVFVYAAVTLGPFNQYSEWLDEYFGSCYYLQSKISLNIFLTGRSVEAENDGVRSINKHFRFCVGALMVEYLKKFDTPHKIVEEIDLDKRYAEVLRIINEKI